jgi:hypothetical protein
VYRQHRTGGKLLRWLGGYDEHPRRRSSWPPWPGPSVLSQRVGPEKVGTNMIDPRVEGPSDSRRYGRWPDPWRSDEDDWAPLLPAVIFLMILAALIIYGSAKFS